MLPLASRRTITRLSEIPLAFSCLDAPVFVPPSIQHQLAVVRRHSICNGRTRIELFSTSTSRSFTGSTRLFRNMKGKKGREEMESNEHYSNSRRANSTSEITATPLTDSVSLKSLKTEIQSIQEKLKKGLGTLPVGGRFNPALIETLRVDISKLTSARNTSNSKENRGEVSPADQESAEAKRENRNKNKARPTKPIIPTAALTEMAQVIPRGAKTVLVMLNEEAFAKPVMSALLSSPFSLNPSPSASNPLELIVPVPPPSAQLRSHHLGQLDKFKDRADSALREGRASMQKELRTLQLGNQIRPDDHHDLSKRMEKLVEEAKMEIKRLYDASRKVLQS